MGKIRPTFADWQLPLPAGCITADLTLADLIREVVLAEVAADVGRQSQHQLLQVLSPAQINAGMIQGKVDLGGSDPVPPPDPQAALAVALSAFKDGLYYVFIDDKQIETLDTPVCLVANSQLLFLRLVALVGG
jgi:hypothetical protein